MTRKKQVKTIVDFFRSQPIVYFHHHSKSEEPNKTQIKQNKDCQQFLANRVNRKLFHLGGGGWGGGTAEMMVCSEGKRGCVRGANPKRSPLSDHPSRNRTPPWNANLPFIAPCQPPPHSVQLPPHRATKARVH